MAAYTVLVEVAAYIFSWSCSGLLRSILAILSVSLSKAISLDYKMYR